jgi:S1-C subfamily serine protease
VRRRGVAAPLLLAVAALAPGCADSASPDPPRVVSVLGAGTERATGFTVGPGRVLTVAHTLPGDAPIRVQAGRDDPRPVRVLRRDARTDLALLAVNGLGGRAIETTAANGGDSVRLRLLRDGGVVTRAARVRRAIEAHVQAPGAARPLRRPALELEARLHAGDSGAPVLTDGGELAGVLFARSRDATGTAYAVDAQAVEMLLNAAPR